jgi:small subunit ribosomal protein S6
MAGGAVEKEEKWGKRKLAYKVSKYSEGFYILLLFTAAPETIHELERRMRVTDMVFKFITVRRDIRLKKIEKRRKHREVRAAKKPPPPSAPPAMPSEPGHSAPGAPGGHAAPGAPAPAAPEEATPVAAAEGTGE